MVCVSEKKLTQYKFKVQFLYFDGLLTPVSISTSLSNVVAENKALNLQEAYLMRFDIESIQIWDHFFKVAKLAVNYFVSKTKLARFARFTKCLKDNTGKFSNTESSLHRSSYTVCFTANNWKEKLTSRMISVTFYELMFCKKPPKWSKSLFISL